MSDVERRADISWEGDLRTGTGTVWGASGGLRQLVINWLSRTESPGGWTSPEEMLCAAHCSSYAMALAGVLTAAGQTPQRFDVSATAVVETEDDRPIAKQIRLTVLGNVPGMKADAFESAAQEAKAACPITALLGTSIEISVEAELREYRHIGGRPAVGA